MSDAVREFLIRTVLQDQVTGGLEKIVDQATELTRTAYTMTVQVVTKEAEKAIADLNKAATKASKIDSSQAIKAHRAHAEVAKGLGDAMKTFAEQSRQASETMGGFFTRLDTGKLVVAGAAAGLSAYAANLVTVYEGFKLNIGMIKDQLGSSSSGLTSFIGQGGQTSGTSESGRAGLLSYMSMTGYRDEKRMQNVAKDAEKIMHSTFGKSLAEFGITDEKSLIKTLSGPMDENSDIGRIVKSKMPTFFKAGTLATEKIKVQGESNYAYQSDEVVEAEARRRLMEKAAKSIAKDVTPDTDSYRLALDDMGEAQNKLSKNVGQALEPALTTITKFTTFAMKMASAAPGITSLAGTVVALGMGLATLGAILPLVQRGFEGVSKSMLHNPMFLAAAAVALLAVGLVALEAKTKIFSKAWDKFSSSEIGKDLINTVKTILDYFGLLGEGDFLSGLGAGILKVAGWIGGLFDQIDAIYKMVKGGDVTGAVKGALGIALKISPIGMAAAFIEGQLPMKKVVDLIYYLLQKMKDAWDGFTRWLSEIWDIIDKLISPIFKLKEWVQKIAEFLFGGEGKTGSALAESVEKEVAKRAGDFMAGSNTTTSFRSSLSESPDLRKFLANLASGTDTKYWESSTGERKFAEASPGEGWKALITTDLGITGPQLAEAKKIAEDLKNPKGVLNGGVSTADIAEGASKGLDDATKTHADQTKKNLEEGKGAGSGFAAADWSLATPLEYGYSALKGIYDEVTGQGIEEAAIGGEVTKDGLLYVHEDEPVVPAEISRSSVLIDRLSQIASGGGSQSTPSGGGTTIQVNLGGITVQAAAGSDGRSLAQQIADELGRELNSFEFSRKVEEAVRRANRTYIG